ncbi:unnamed protein product [Brachionus calyciflorus]|uniref:EF-hand domain-containing protein n=1 Tax=Brachionus calyciflorus TaxID=104777 RepID=A0A813WEK9_9BILA|nr:unnamed protein product [Brachionus calyciflorus]
MASSNPLKGTSPSKLKRIFEDLDLNKDSYITLTEIASSLSKINKYLRANYNLDEIELMFNQIDKNKDKKVGYTEYQEGLFNLNL